MTGQPVTLLENGEEKKYYAQVEDLTMSSDGDGEIRYTAKDQYNIIDKCDHCGRFNIEEKVLYSFAEVIQEGWLVPAEEEKTS